MLFIRSLSIVATGSLAFRSLSSFNVTLSDASLRASIAFALKDILSNFGLHFEQMATGPRVLLSKIHASSLCTPQFVQALITGDFFPVFSRIISFDNEE